jgi:energy-coupling factor transport system permease protein
VHRLDARTKILASLAYMVVLLAGRGPWALGACAAFTAAWLVAARPPLGALWRGNRVLAYLVVATFALGVLLGPVPAPGQRPGVEWRIGPLLVSSLALSAALAAAVRLGLLVLQAALVTATTAPLDLVAGMERLLRPFRRIGVPAHELALMTGLALRFIPVLAEEAQRIAAAQAARGADLQSPGRARLRALVALVVPLLLSVFRRADQLALAMEARGYRGEEGRSRWRQSRFGRADLVAAGAALALAVSVVAASVGWRGGA